jgi:hypothetical protein
MLELNNMAFMDAIGHNMPMPSAHVDTLHAVSHVVSRLKCIFFVLVIILPNVSLDASFRRLLWAEAYSCSG